MKKIKKATKFYIRALLVMIILITLTDTWDALFDAFIEIISFVLFIGILFIAGVAIEVLLQYFKAKKNKSTF